MGFFSRFFGRKENNAKYFRELENFLGVPEIEGLDAITDQRIDEICGEVRGLIDSISTARNEVIPQSAVDGLVRDRLIDEVHGNYRELLNFMTEMYSKHGLRAILVDGRIY